MGIHVVQSQSIDVLIEAMLRIQQANVTPLAVLKSQHVVVPSLAMEAWLKQQMAIRRGISANYVFYPGLRGFQWTVYQAVLHQQRDQVRQANIPRVIIHWRVYQALVGFIEPEHNPLKTTHPLYAIVQRIFDSAKNLMAPESYLKKQRMLYWVAAQVSRLFSNYMLYRGNCPQGCVDQCSCSSNWLHQWGKNQPLAIEKLIFKASHDDQLHGKALFEFKQQKGTGLEAWQRWLWQAVFHEDFLEIEKIDILFWQQLEQEHTRQQALAQLPEQITVFTLLELAPIQLQFLRRLGQYVDIFVFHYNPSREYWADMVDPHWKKASDAKLKDRFNNSFEKKYQRQPTDAEINAFSEKYHLNFNSENRESHHPLLTRFGKQARDHFSLLANLATGEEGEWIDIFPETEPQHLLSKVQSDILQLLEPQPHQYVIEPQDDSIQIHVCHSSTRQLEVLKDHLVHWLAQGSAEDPRQPHDILVLSPNLKELESSIRSVFAPPPQELRQHQHLHQQRLNQHSVYLPIQIAGVTQLEVNNAWQAVLGRIQLLQGRFNLEEFSDWLSLEATQQYYQLDLSAVDRIIELLQQSGFRRGFDAEHLQLTLSNQDQDFRYSFAFALERLTLGMAIPQHQLFLDTLSFADVLVSDFPYIGTLLQIQQDIAQRRHWLNPLPEQAATGVEVWLKRLMNDVKQFIDQGVDALKLVYQLIKKQDRILTLANFYDEKNKHNLKRLHLPLSYVIDEIQQLLIAQLEQAEPTGHITFSQMGTIRPIPYKLIVMLNLDSGKFPNREQHIAFDLMEILKPQLGDRSRLDDDQGAFLDALLLAKDNLWLFYNGFDVNDGHPREPSYVLQELISHLDLISFNDQPNQLLTDTVQQQGIEIAKQLVSLYHFHPLQPFDLTSFKQQDQRFKDQWYIVAEQIAQAKGQRSPWNEGLYTPIQQEIKVLNSTQWIADVLFPAQAYLKAVGIKNLALTDVPEQQESLLLSKLDQYQLRHFLLNEKSSAVELLKDVLPVGKTQQPTWQLGQIEYQSLILRLQQEAGLSEPTVTTHYLWRFSANIHLNIVVPESDKTLLWASVLASSAKGQRRSAIWLEYILWLASLNLGDAGTEHKRVVVCNEKTIEYKGLSSNQAKLEVEKWLDFWHQCQTRAVLLPADLVLHEKVKIQWDEQHQVINLNSFLTQWNQQDNFAGYSYVSTKWSHLHQDWQFILQDMDKTQIEERLSADFEKYAFTLYGALVQHQAIKELAT